MSIIDSRICETERQFGEGIIDHNKRYENAHVLKYCNENSYPHIQLNDFEKISKSYGNQIKGEISEALLINGLKL